MDSLLFPISESGYSFTEPPVVVAVRTKGGLSRGFSDMDIASFPVKVSWLFVKADYATFVTFFEVNLVNGSLAFIIPLIINDWNLVNYVANFSTAGYTLNKIQGFNYTVSATLIVQPLAINATADNAIIAAYELAHP